MSTENNDLHERILNLENEVRSLKNKSSNTDEKPTKEKKEKKPRAPTEYNKFVSCYINDQKEKLGTEFKHKIAFAEAAKKWNENKELNKQKTE